MAYYLSLFVVGFSLFSMFFGGGNLVFPLWVGMSTTSPFLSIIGFVLSSILLPFYGVIIGVYFKGDYKKCLGAWGPAFAHLFIFLLLLFWIPLGSGPRCNQLAYGAFAEIFGGMPLWLYSLLYSVLVYFLTLHKEHFLGILGKIVTPLLVFFLFILIFSIFSQTFENSSFTGDMEIGNFYSSMIKGYNTMDFIAAIFFASTIISLLKARQKENFQFSFVLKASLFAVSLLTIVYLGMFTIGCLKADVIQSVSGARLLVTIGHHMLGKNWNVLMFLIISLSVLSTSMALSLVFSDYLNKTIFKEKVSYKSCLLMSVSICFFMSIMGFENLSIFISYVMTILYPVLLITTTVSACKKLFAKAPALEEKRINDTI